MSTDAACVMGSLCKVAMNNKYEKNGFGLVFEHAYFAAFAFVHLSCENFYHVMMILILLA